MALAGESLIFDADVLERLNRLSLTRSFTPQLDIDWNEVTTDDEYASLYPVWSLFQGTGLDDDLGREERVKFVKYQQMNLMLFTGLLDATPSRAEQALRSRSGAWRLPSTSAISSRRKSITT